MNRTNGHGERISIRAVRAVRGFEFSKTMAAPHSPFTVILLTTRRTPFTELAMRSARDLNSSLGSSPLKVAVPLLSFTFIGWVRSSEASSSFDVALALTVTPEVEDA